MDENKDPVRAFEAQVRGVIGSTLSTTGLEDGAYPWPQLPEELAHLGIGAQPSSRMAETEAFIEELTTQGAKAMRALVPRGWSPWNMPDEVVQRAVALVESGDAEQADDLLADQWQGHGAWRTAAICDEVSVMGRADSTFHAMFTQRARLLRLAKDHHEAGRYDASIPQLHAQIEGIAIDVTPKWKFFTKGTQKADVVDPTQLDSLAGNLAALQVHYGADVASTQVKGELSRHGIVHGRELAYDTRINSAKSWSVLGAVVRWAQPLAELEAARQGAGRRVAATSSSAVQEDGRRVDDREFAETKHMLRILSRSAKGWWRQHERFREDLIGAEYTVDDFMKRGLPAEYRTGSAVTADGQQVWFWRQTISGWVLALAVAVHEGTFVQWLYAGSVVPEAGPLENPELWGEASGQSPPDWR